MEDIITRRDVPEIQKLLNEAKEGVKGSDIVFIANLEKLIRFHAFEVSRSPDASFKQEAREHFLFVAELCKQGAVTMSTCVLVLQDIFETSRIGRCERLFDVVEENITLLKQPPFVDPCQTPVLRMCNDLLKRLSRTVDTSFCGRVLFFLSRFLSLSEKSGLNLVGHFNTQNVTSYDMIGSQSTELLPATVVEEDLEMGEIKDSKDSTIPIDHELYTTFWRLQNYFCNPFDCYDKSKWTIFQKGISTVFSLFSTYKLDKGGDDERKRKSDKMAEEDEADNYFAKYLTSPKLLQLQLNDSQFRRYFLTQCAVIFQFLAADVKIKARLQALNEEQTTFVKENQEKCFRLMKDTHPKGSFFVDSVKAILVREKDWSTWKNQSCPNMEANADKHPMQLYRRRPRVLFDSSTIDLGSSELTKLWNIEPNMLEACKSKKRKFAPHLVDFLRDPLDEMDPEQQVEEEYKSVNNAAYQWKASRFMLMESGYYFGLRGQKAIPEFLESVIYETAKNMKTYQVELAEREEREARKKVEQSMIKKLKDSENEGSCSPSSAESSLSPETIANIAKELSAKLTELPQKLSIDYKIDPDKTDEENTLGLLTEFSEKNNNSVKKLLNALLVAELLSTEVLALLK